VQDIVFFDPISIPVPHQSIYHRLGYRQGATRVSPAQEKEIEVFLNEAVELIHLKGAMRRCRIKKNIDSITLSTGEILRSRHLAAFLKEAEETLLIAATAGKTIVEAIGKNISGGLAAKGAIFDAVASEMTDAALDWIMSYANTQLRRESKYLMPKRYSCGYGDFLLENQKRFHELLRLRQLDIEINDACLLVPEKSVTAITGVLDLGKK
jgi:hypothetical protein